MMMMMIYWVWQPEAGLREEMKGQQKTEEDEDEPSNLPDDRIQYSESDDVSWPGNWPRTTLLIQAG